VAAKSKKIRRIHVVKPEKPNANKGVGITDDRAIPVPRRPEFFNEINARPGATDGFMDRTGRR